MGRIDTVLKDINRYFGFLFERGYKLRSADDYPRVNGNWIVVLESQACVIHITSDRDSIVVDFGPIFLERVGQYRIGIKAMVYYISKGQHFVGTFDENSFWNRQKQYKELAGLLKDYIDQIEPYFGNGFEKYKDELISAQKKYNNLVIESNLQIMKKKW
jgi:hypothetical protein